MCKFYVKCNVNCQVHMFEKGIETTEGATVEQKKLGRDKIDDLPLFGEIFKKQPNFPYHILS